MWNLIKPFIIKTIVVLLPEILKQLEGDKARLMAARPSDVPPEAPLEYTTAYLTAVVENVVK